jgi:hypothetical protein
MTKKKIAVAENGIEEEARLLASRIGAEGILPDGEGDPDSAVELDALNALVSNATSPLLARRSSREQVVCRDKRPHIEKAMVAVMAREGRERRTLAGSPGKKRRGAVHS